MSMKTFTIVFALLSLTTVFCSNEYRKETFDNGNYKVSWMYNKMTGYLNFHLEVKTTGWVGFGFALTAPNSMQKYDVVVGGVTDNGTSYFDDYFTNGRQRPPKDISQDYKLVNASEYGGWTKLSFRRMADTGDNLSDIKITAGLKVHLVYAYSTKDADTAKTFSEHTFKGISPLVEIIPPSAGTPTANVTSIKKYQSQVIFDGGNFNVTWAYDMYQETLTFHLKVRSTGWVGFGFAPKAPNNMTGYDVAVGGVNSNGSSYFQDYYTTGLRRPSPDISQDYKLINASEREGVTSLYFYRKRYTNDSNDMQFKDGTTAYLVWAYHSNSDMFTKHTKRGVSNEAFVMVPGIPKTTPFPVTEAGNFTAPVRNITPSPEMPIVFENQMTFDEGRFKVYWTYTNSTDMLHFKLEVKTKGWVSFGFTTTPTGMDNYDIAIGWVDANGMAYLQDYFTVGPEPPKEDSEQDFKLGYFKEENGTTMLQFYRKRDTNDIKDLKLQKGMEVYLVWAYGKEDNLAYHGPTKGYSGKVILVPAPTPATVTMRTTNSKAKTTASTTTATKPKTMTPARINFIKKMMFNDGKFQASYAYDNQTDMLHFKLEVMTQGWVSFGFTTTPRGMENYDVAIGGVNTDGSSYLKDYITIGQTAPREDTQQDFKILYAKEENGKTILHFYRKRDTMSTEDLSFKESSEQFYFVWAYGNEDVLSYHGRATRGYSGKLSTAALLGMELMPMITTVTDAPGNQGNSGNQAGNSVFDKPTRDMLVILVATSVGLSGVAVILILVALVLINRKRAKMEFKITDSRM